jgi:predicted metal-dependent enzyme (double-stranded beta helix superfamily)
MNRLRDFVQAMTRLVERHGAHEPKMLDEGEALLRRLIARDDWLPEAFGAHSPESYRHYLLHCDPLERFSVVSFVWMPGQKTPIHGDIHVVSNAGAATALPRRRAAEPVGSI